MLSLPSITRRTVDALVADASGSLWWSSSSGLTRNDEDLWELTMMEAQSIDLISSEGWMAQGSILLPIEKCLSTLLVTTPRRVLVWKAALISLAAIVPQIGTSLVIWLSPKPMLHLSYCSFSQLMLRWSSMASCRSLRVELTNALVNLQVSSVEVCSHLASVAVAIELLHEASHQADHLLLSGCCTIAAELVSFLGTRNAREWSALFEEQMKLSQLREYLQSASKWMMASWLRFCQRGVSDRITSIFVELEESVESRAFSIVRLFLVDPLELGVEVDAADNVFTCALSSECVQTLSKLCTTGVSPVWDGWLRAHTLPSNHPADLVDSRLPWYRKVFVGRKSFFTDVSDEVSQCTSRQCVLMTAVEFLRRFQLVDRVTADDEPVGCNSLRTLFNLKDLHPINAVRVLCARAGITCSVESEVDPRSRSVVPVVPQQVEVNPATGLVRLSSVHGMLALRRLLLRAQESVAAPAVQAYARAWYSRKKITGPLVRRLAVRSLRLIVLFVQSALSQRIALRRGELSARARQAAHLLPTIIAEIPIFIAPQRPSWCSDHVARMEQKYRALLTAEEALQFDSLILKPSSKMFPTVRVRREEYLRRAEILQSAQRIFVVLVQSLEEHQRDEIISEEAQGRHSTVCRQISAMMTHLTRVWEPFRRRLFVEEENRERSSG